MKDLRTFDHGKDVIRLKPGPGRSITEARPIELHHKEDGAQDNSPSFAIVVEDLNGNKVVGQVSLKMLTSALAELGYTLTKI